MGIEFKGGVPKKFVRIESKAVVVEATVNHRDVIVEMTGEQPVELDRLLTEHNLDVDMGELTDLGNGRVKIGGKSTWFNFPPRAPAIRGPLREKTAQVLAELFPKNTFDIEGK